MRYNASLHRERDLFLAVNLYHNSTVVYLETSLWLIPPKLSYYRRNKCHGRTTWRVNEETTVTPSGHKRLLYLSYDTSVWQKDIILSSEMMIILPDWATWACPRSAALMVASPRVACGWGHTTDACTWSCVALAAARRAAGCSIFHAPACLQVLRSSRYGYLQSVWRHRSIGGVNKWGDESFDRRKHIKSQK